MKTRFCIFSLFLLALASCHGPFGTRSNASSDAVVSPEPQSPQRSQLLAIDSLAWQQPDSALALLLPWFDTVDSSQAFDNHYAQLLLAELLYKNDYAQTNRDELLQAVDYFDSVTATTGWADTRGVSLHDVFLAARAHYINGVGYYEQDSAVPACREYLKALEIMEEHFEEKEIVGEKARFMALTHTRLVDLFSDLYLHEQTIYFGKNAWNYYKKCRESVWQQAWVLNGIGSQFEMLDNYDSAYFYYHKCLSVVPDTNNLIYRDVSTLLAFLSYKKGGASTASLEQLQIQIAHSETPKEALSRCAIIGEIYYHEKQFDSAWLYLNKVFRESQSVDSRKQAAEWLVEISELVEVEKDDEMADYARFLVPFSTISENQGYVKSQMAKFCQEYEKARIENQHRKQQRRFTKQLVMALAMLATLTIVIVLAFHIAHMKRHKIVRLQKEATEKQLQQERYANAMQKKVLAAKLKKSNLALKELGTRVFGNPITGETQNQNSFPEDFAHEPVCQHILAICNDKKTPIKSSVPASAYADLAITHEQKIQLLQAAKRHYGSLYEKLKSQQPSLKEKDWLYCCLCLLGLNNAQIAALLQKSNSTIWDREKRLQKLFGFHGKVSIFLYHFKTN